MNVVEFLAKYVDLVCCVCYGEDGNAVIRINQVTAKSVDDEIVEFVIDHPIDGREGLIWQPITKIDERFHNSWSLSSAIKLSIQIIMSQPLDLGLLNDVEIDLPWEDHKLIKKAADARGITMEQFMCEVIEDMVEKHRDATPPPV